MSSPAELRFARRRRLWAGPVAALALLFLFGTGVASAHATLVTSDPGDGATLADPPDHIRLTFSEAVSAELSRIRLVGVDGQVLAGASIAADPSDPAVLLVRMPPIETGIYRLEWRVVDGNDLHATESTMVFGLRAAVAPSGAAAGPAPNALEAAIAFVDHALQAALVGALAMLAVTHLAARRLRGRGRRAPTAQPSPDAGRFAPARARLRSFAVSAGVDAVACGIVLILVQTAAVAGDQPFGAAFLAVLATGHGMAWLIHEAALVGLTILVLRSIGERAGREETVGDRARPADSPLAAIVLVGGLAVAAALGGHGNIGGPDETPLRIIALAIHDLAAATWVGGLLVLALVVAPLVRRVEDRAAARSLLGAFGWIALPSVVALATTGMYLAGQMVATVDALGSTDYGRVLLAKTALVLVLLAIGATHATSLHRGLRSAVRGVVPAGLVRRATTARPVATLRLEAATALLVVLFAAVLGASAPARGAGLEPAVDGSDRPEVAARADDLLVSFALRPNRPGENFVSIGVFDTRRPQPAPIEAVTVRLVSPAGDRGPSVTALRRSEGRYEAALTAIASAGDWQVAIEVQRPGMTVARLDSAWTVRPPAAAAPPSPWASIRLGSITTPLAAVVLALTLAGAAVATRRRLYHGSRATAVPVTGTRVVPSSGGHLG